MGRAERKLQHIQHALNIEMSATNRLEDIQFVHQGLPNLSTDDILLETKIGELNLSSPILINAMTGGGGEKTADINRRLARIANQCNIPIAVGSQMAAIKDINETSTFRVVREENPNGIVFANLGSEATVDQAKQAINMLAADAIQIHLNVIQELTMPEGDRDFSEVLFNLEQMVKEIEVPVIVKEVGFGISQETAIQLTNIGVQIIDVGGYGGTNFAKIENKRRSDVLDFFNDWGIPTAISVAEVSYRSPSISIISSGGIYSVLDVAKSIALGASAVAFAGYFLKILMDQGEESLIATIQSLKEDLTILMTALGTPNIETLQKAPLIISGPTHHWLNERGIDTKLYSCRKL
ncbi:type 2 isopentenyl-diphosphate Delta-isomerase [Bacillus sp. Marseille-P3661]|uniref:type 2 isopentenyl-diphosphate Delta-isomerase n=1 Tax=Bacillus sp. Marseille-P3661 TaxID=1936234 RepID=UPI000C829C38|nr:type 2 isopentenyl-diphosphate Delta-isomerase [Bacillus sp. Marseille-P3661]